MKSNPPVKHSSRVIPIFNRIFPHKLKYQCLSRRLGLPTLPTQQQTQQLGFRRFSTFSGRPSPGSSADAKALKSLIDDEALGSVRERGSDRRRGRDEKGGTDRVSSAKRRRESDSADYSTLNRKMGSDSFSSFSRNSRGKARFGVELEGKGEGLGSRRRENGWRGEKNSTVSKRGGRVSEFGNGQDQGDSGGDGLKGGGKSLRRGGFVTSDDEIGDDDEEEGEERSMKSFRHLISEEDSEEGDGDADADDVSNGDMRKNAGPLFAAKKEASSRSVPSSPGRSDSYLSETRRLEKHGLQNHRFTGETLGK